MTGALTYFCMMAVVLFFRRLCSEPPSTQYHRGAADGWWFKTAVLMVAWPIIAPLAGAFHTGKTVRNMIEAHNARVEQQTRSLK